MMRLHSFFQVTVPIVALVPFSALAHDGHSHSYEFHEHPEPVRPNLKQAVEAVNRQPQYALVFFQAKGEELNKGNKPDIAGYFDKFKGVKTRWDSDTLFVESNGLPDHKMMVGIRSWQQQVPLPQPFTGDNAWQ